ncbi:39S ribosomal protein L21: mitochondrial-like protein [Dinothrombium tinctorium]|uniref:Large ribosomal subunit protein bL21m n=1 Tax=Dinothrombium tinctorium TaxID=1965070 RepID=A0A443RD48_9ACAR|nr:39S ribosomal protein L21: mitochondrial-like protein [Dinothrombium tinctorium]
MATPRSYNLQEKVQILRDEEKEEEQQRVRQFFRNANDCIEQSKNEKHFAVIHFYGHQYLVKEGDIIIVDKYVPAEMGARIKFEKCLLVGNQNLTLIGRPLLNRDMVHVEGTVVEKTMSHTVLNMIFKKRSSGWRKWYFHRFPLTMFRINEVKICHKLNESQTIIQ